MDRANLFPRASSSLRVTRRQALKTTAGLAAGVLLRSRLTAATPPGGVIRGEPSAEKVGQQVLAEGGNAVDALVAGAFACTVTAPQMTGIGGYAATIIIAPPDGRGVIAIDANSTAPAAARADMFKPDAAGKVAGRANELGWLAAGVPGVLAGLQVALDRHGSRRLSDCIRPSIALARDGFVLPANIATAIKNFAGPLTSHPGGEALFMRQGRLPVAGETLRNPELAAVLETLAQRNSVDSFYRGDLARRIAEDFARHGGLVTFQDLAAYQAKVVEPLRLRWDGREIVTPPLTAGGLTVLQCLNTLRALRWGQYPPGIESEHAYLEALRLAWRDRLALLGDPDHASVPQEKLLSSAYAEESAAQVRSAVAARKILAHAATPRDHGGTINLSVVDRTGMMAAITLTHGNSFGACVTIAGLGVTLGHGMSRFDPEPGHPNAPAPGKRPLHNMSPAIVLSGGRPVLAVGGRGGRKIPNAVLTALAHATLRDSSMEQAVAAPRVHTEGTPVADFEPGWPAEHRAALAQRGYTVKTSASATLSAVAFNPATGETRGAMR
jgi:gamma-glutamyltranspeptidase/glutathione hydrolase